MAFARLEEVYCQGLDLLNVAGCVPETRGDKDLEFDYFLELAQGRHVTCCGLSRDQLSITEGMRGRTTHQWDANLA